MLACNDLAQESHHSDAAAKAEGLLTSLANGAAGGHDVAAALRRLSSASSELPLDRIAADVEAMTKCQENWD